MHNDSHVKIHPKTTDKKFTCVVEWMNDRLLFFRRIFRSRRTSAALFVNIEAGGAGLGAFLERWTLAALHNFQLENYVVKKFFIFQSSVA